MFSTKTKRKRELLAHYKEAKTTYFDFERIGLYAQHQSAEEAYQILDDRTLSDLDFEELFMYLDRTQSAPGQQYLYATLSTLPAVAADARRFEPVITRLRSDEQNREAAVWALHQLSEPSAYYLQELIFGQPQSKPGWYWLMPVLSTVAVLLLLAALFYPVVLLAALPVLSVNLYIHYWNKNNVMAYAGTLPVTFRLRRVANTLCDLGLINKEGAVKTALERLKQLGRAAAFFNWETQVRGELGQLVEYVADLVKGVFLLEPLLFYRLLHKLAQRKAEINQLFVAVATVDVALSIDSWREGLSSYCQPEIGDMQQGWVMQQLYHPLVAAPVANDLTISNGKSILLSGSNMSGKTTYIRTVGLNALLAQTINTVCAAQFALPRCQIYSAIRIADNLLKDRSYYQEEVRRVKQLLAARNTAKSCLFLLDELFKGTNTIERIASGKAVLSYLQGPQHLVFCASHDLELMDYLSKEYDFYHFTEQVSGSQLQFDYLLKPDRLSQTNAIKILEIYDFPAEITAEARQLAKKLGKATLG